MLRCTYLQTLPKTSGSAIYFECGLDQETLWQKVIISAEADAGLREHDIAVRINEIYFECALDYDSRLEKEISIHLGLKGKKVC